MSPIGVVAREALGVMIRESALESQVEGGKKNGKGISIADRALKWR